MMKSLAILFLGVSLNVFGTTVDSDDGFRSRIWDYAEFTPLKKQSTEAEIAATGLRIYTGTIREKAAVFVRTKNEDHLFVTLPKKTLSWNQARQACLDFSFGALSWDLPETDSIVQAHYDQLDQGMLVSLVSDRNLVQKFKSEVFYGAVWLKSDDENVNTDRLMDSSTVYLLGGGFSNAKTASLGKEKNKSDIEKNKEAVARAEAKKEANIKHYGQELYDYAVGGRKAVIDLLENGLKVVCHTSRPKE